MILASPFLSSLFSLLFFPSFSSFVSSLRVSVRGCEIQADAQTAARFYSPAAARAHDAHTTRAHDAGTQVRGTRGRGGGGREVCRTMCIVCGVLVASVIADVVVCARSLVSTGLAGCRRLLSCSSSPPTGPPHHRPCTRHTRASPTPHTYRSRHGAGSQSVNDRRDRRRRHARHAGTQSQRAHSLRHPTQRATRNRHAGDQTMRNVCSGCSSICSVAFRVALSLLRCSSRPSSFRRRRGTRATRR